MKIERRTHREVFADYKAKLDALVKKPVTFLWRGTSSVDPQLVEYHPDNPTWKYHLSFPSGDYYIIHKPEGVVYSDETANQMSYIAKFSLQQLPGCCGVVVSYHAATFGGYMHKGLGKFLNHMRLEWARAMGYGVVLCTDITNVTSPTWEQSILTKNGWKELYKFKNPRTTNNITMSVINLLE